MIAVCLLTCDRPELTRRTVRSFVAENRGREDLLLLHADGGSETAENGWAARQNGFRTLCEPKPSDRIGQMETLRVFLDALRETNIEWVCWLENDWESVAPLPAESFCASSGAETVRLFGALKFRDGHRARAGTERIRCRKPIEWYPTTIGWEFGLAHWGAGGTIVRRRYLEKYAHLARLKDVITAEDELPSIRPVDNLMWSIGMQTTPGFIG